MGKELRTQLFNAHKSDLQKQDRAARTILKAILKSDVLLCIKTAYASTQSSKQDSLTTTQLLLPGIRQGA
jgi:hypothetical protein